MSIGPHNRHRTFTPKASKMAPEPPRVLRTAEPCTGWCWMCGDIIRSPAVMSVITNRQDKTSRMRLCERHWRALQIELGGSIAT